MLQDFLRLDDHDVMGAVKVWAQHPDKVLSAVCDDLVHRCTYRIRLLDRPWESERISRIKAAAIKHTGCTPEQADHFVLTGRVVNNAYDPRKDRIDLHYKDGSLRDIAAASDNHGILALSRPVEKWYLAYPRWLGKEWVD